MIATQEEPIDLGRFIHPRSSPRSPACSPAMCPPPRPITSVLAATGPVLGAGDVLDSRDADFSFTYTDVVAENVIPVAL